MKFILALALATLTFSNVSARADARFPDQEEVALQCRDNVNIADGGFYVEIVQGGITGLTFAHLYDQSIAGPMNESRIVVRVRDMGNAPMGAPLVYSARNFRLSVNFTTSPVEGRYNRGHLTAQVGGRLLNLDLLCQSIYRTL